MQGAHLGPPEPPTRQRDRERQLESAQGHWSSVRARSSQLPAAARSPGLSAPSVMPPGSPAAPGAQQGAQDHSSADRCPAALGTGRPSLDGLSVAPRPSLADGADRALVSQGNRDTATGQEGQRGGAGHAGRGGETSQRPGAAPAPCAAPSVSPHPSVPGNSS